MATKSSSKTTTTSSSSSSSKKSFSMSYFLNILSFVAVVVGGLALFISTILSYFDIAAGFVSAMQTIATSIAWIVVAIYSFNFIKRRRKIWMWVVWAIALVMVITGIILA